ncbi:MAG: endonuclease [Bacteroidetes bacterium]|nr:endonuclease [Bacteroidota bacterium]
MKNFLWLFFLIPARLLVAQVPAYYSSIDFSQTGLPLKNQLATLITNTHTTPISYADVWTVLQVSDLDPTNSAKVLLAYGYNDSDGNIFNDRTRDKTNYGGSSGQWNREHTFAKSLGVPDLGTSGPGSDAHNLRASDVDQNASRGNLLFADGSGNAGTTGAYWYPGDEWKGDCARIIMYMYLRYGLQCRPYYCASGTANSIDANMVNVLLDWNAEDVVSQLEKNRNDEIQSWQGNRNPFIDNPYIATKIWGGTPAEDTWGGLGFEQVSVSEFVIYPVPASDHTIYVNHTGSAAIETIRIFDLNGRLISTYTLNQVLAAPFEINHVPGGTWLLTIQTEQGSTTQKIVVE